MCLMIVPGPDSATPEATNRSLDRALIEAAGRNDVAMVRRLLKQGASVQAQDGQVRTALLSAVDRNHVASAKLLIKAGAVVNLPDGEGISPLLHARNKGFTPIAGVGRGPLESRPLLNCPYSDNNFRLGIRDGAASRKNGASGFSVGTRQATGFF